MVSILSEDFRAFHFAEIQKEYNASGVSILSEDFRAFHASSLAPLSRPLRFQSSARISVHFTNRRGWALSALGRVSILSEDFRAFHPPGSRKDIQVLIVSILSEDFRAFHVHSAGGQRADVLFQSSARISVHFTRPTAS